MSFSAESYFRSVLTVGHETPRKLLATCPFCRGSENHPYPMALMKASGFVCCQRCGFGSRDRGGSKSIHDLVADLEGVTIEEARRIVLSGGARRVKLRGTIEGSLAAADKVDPRRAPRIPARWLKRFSPLEGPLASVKRAVLYLEGRGIGPEETERYGIRLGQDVFANRVMVPVLEKGEVLFFTGRAIFPKEKLRYRDAVRGEDCPFNKDEVVWNLEAATPFKHMVLTEGPFDAIWTDIALREYQFAAAAGSPFGKRVSDVQVARLVTAGLKRVTLMLDSAGVSTEEEHAYLMRLRPHFDTRVVWLPKQFKDPAECPAKILVDLVERATSVSNRLNYMKARLAGKGSRS